MAKSAAMDRMTIERGVLRRFIEDKRASARNILRIKEYMFSSVSRLMIFQIIKEYFSKYKDTINRRSLLRRIEKRAAERVLIRPKNAAPQELKGYRKRVVDQKKFAKVEVREIFSLDEAIWDIDFQALLDDLLSEVRAKEIVDTAVQMAERASERDPESAERILKSYALSMRKNVYRESRIIRVKNWDAIKKEIVRRKKYPHLYAGLKTGIPTIDNKLGGLFRNEMALVFAHTGSGKSTIGRNIVVGMLMRNELNVLHITNEEPDRQVRMKYAAIVSDEPYFKFKEASITHVEMRTARKVLMDGRLKGEVYINNVPQLESVEEVRILLERLRDRGVRIDVLVIDWIDKFVPTESRKFGQWDDESLVVSELKNIVEDYNICCIPISQARSDSTKVKKPSDATSDLVFGSKEKIKLSHVVFFVTGLGKRSGICTVMMMKTRDLTETGYFKMEVFESGKMIEIENSFRPHNWR